MNKKVLHLSLKKEPFDVMVTGEKFIEFRNPTKWIMSRLENKDGTPKKYDVIKFTNGYRPTKPNFVCQYKGFDEVDEQSGPVNFEFSNGLNVTVKPIMWVLCSEKAFIRPIISIFSVDNSSLFIIINLFLYFF